MPSLTDGVLIRSSSLPPTAALLRPLGVLPGRCLVLCACCSCMVCMMIIIYDKMREQGRRDGVGERHRE